MSSSVASADNPNRGRRPFPTWAAIARGIWNGAMWACLQELLGTGWPVVGFVVGGVLGSLGPVIVWVIQRTIDPADLGNATRFRPLSPWKAILLIIGPGVGWAIIQEWFGAGWTLAGILVGSLFGLLDALIVWTTKLDLGQALSPQRMAGFSRTSAFPLVLQQLYGVSYVVLTMGLVFNLWWPGVLTALLICFLGFFYWWVGPLEQLQLSKRSGFLLITSTVIGLVAGAIYGGLSFGAGGAFFVGSGGAIIGAGVGFILRAPRGALWGALYGFVAGALLIGGVALVNVIRNHQPVLRSVEDVVQGELVLALIGAVLGAIFGTLARRGCSPRMPHTAECS